MKIEIFQKMIALRGFISIVRNPGKTHEVFSMASALVDDAMINFWIQKISSSEQARSALQIRPRLGVITRDELSKYSRGSLGRAYLDHLNRNHIDPETLPRLESLDERSYMLAHIYECHDIWHTVTGFGTSVADELGLQAFYTAQGPTNGPWALLTAGFLNTLLYRLDEKDERMEAVARGWFMGRRAKILFGTDWKAFFNRSLKEVRRDFGIENEISRKAFRRAS